MTQVCVCWAYWVGPRHAHGPLASRCARVAVGRYMPWPVTEGDIEQNTELVFLLETSLSRNHLLLFLLFYPNSCSSHSNLSLILQILYQVTLVIEIDSQGF